MKAEKKKQQSLYQRITHPVHKESLFVAFNLVIVISTIIITIVDIIYGTNGGQSGFLVQGWNYFVPFTINSNILMAIASSIVLVKLLRYHRRARYFSSDQKAIHGRKITNYYYMSVVSLNLTAVTVTLFLAPLSFIKEENGFNMFLGDMFFFHLVNPILATYSLLYLYEGTRLSQSSRLLCFVPPLFYSLVYSTHVLILRDWEDFYNFTFDGNYLLATLSATANIIAIYTIATLFANAYNKRIEEKPLPKIILPRLNTKNLISPRQTTRNNP